MKFKNIVSYSLLITLIILLLNLIACGSINRVLVDKKTNKEYYHIFDIKTKTEGKKIAKSVSSGIQKNVNSLDEAWPIPPKEVPKEAGRFETKQPLEGTTMGALTSGAGKLAFKTVKCDGAIWTGEAISETSTDKTKVNICLWPYKDGYHLNFYMQFREKELNFMQSIVAPIVYTAIGDPQKWLNKLVLDTVQQVDSDYPKVKITHMEGRPEEIKNLPWHEQGKTNY